VFKDEVEVRTGEENQEALVPAQSTALTRVKPKSLAAGALADLRTQEAADEWLRKGHEFRGQARYEEALECFERGIELKPNQPEIQFMLGLSFDVGEGVPRNLEMARAWYRKAAMQGLKEAQYNLGLCYYGWADGPGLQQIYQEAAIWFRKAAEQGCEKAQSRLSLLYELGIVAPQDPAEAVVWYRKSAEQGDNDSQRFLGDWYRSGQGVLQDYAQAASWYRKAARQEDLSAQISLAQMYSQGLVPVTLYADFAFREANCGETQAGLFLDDAIYRRHGCKEAAAFWFTKAAQQGSEVADSALAELQPLLTLERAKRIIELSEDHINFGSNVEARKRHYADIQDAATILKDAGYRVKRVGWGYKLEYIQ
jgi:TPR repeat protein